MVITKPQAEVIRLRILSEVPEFKELYLVGSVEWDGSGDDIDMVALMDVPVDMMTKSKADFKKISDKFGHAIIAKITGLEGLFIISYSKTGYIPEKLASKFDNLDFIPSILTFKYLTGEKVEIVLHYGTTFDDVANKAYYKP